VPLVVVALAAQGASVRQPQGPPQGSTNPRGVRRDFG
jgi:hypothetical protein